MVNIVGDHTKGKSGSVADLVPEVKRAVVAHQKRIKLTT